MDDCIRPRVYPWALCFGREVVAQGMLYTAAVAQYLAVRSLQRSTLGDPGVGVFEDGYAASLLFGPTLGLEHPLTGQGGFVVAEANPDIPARLGSRPLAGSAVLGWLNDRGLMLYRPVLDVTKGWGNRTINPTSPPAWIVKPWTGSQLPVTSQYLASWQAIKSVWGKIIAANVLPEGSAGRILALTNAGFLIFPKTSTLSMPGMTPEQMLVWESISQELRPIAKLASANNMDMLRIEGERLDANADFWAGVERMTRAIATVGVSELGGGGKNGLWIGLGILAAGAAYVATRKKGNG
jgi:hypothetical protein